MTDTNNNNGDGILTLAQQQELNNQQQRANNQQQQANNQQKQGSGERAKTDKGEDDKGKDDGDQKEGEQKRSKKPLIILAIIVLVLLAVIIIWSITTANLESTDDAYTDGNTITIAPKISGYVVELDVTDNSFVHAGDLILKIDPRDYINARDTAAANLALAKAQYDIAKVKYPAQLAQAKAQKLQSDAAAFQADQEYKRQHSVNQRATTQTNVDTATAQQKSAEGQVVQSEAQIDIAKPITQYLRAAEAQVAQAQAQLDQAELNLSWTEMRAPQDGWVTRRNVQLGSYLEAGQSLFQLVTKDIWIVANFKESQLVHMRAGQKVDISVDAYPNLDLVGHLDTIQMGSGSRFSAFPAENATGNFVKIVQRVPVKIIIDGDKDGHNKKDNNDWQTLPIGLSVEPTVHLGTEPKQDQKKQDHK